MEGVFTMHKKTVLVTGATSGLGYHIAMQCLEKGYVVYATGRNKEALQSLELLGAHIIVANLLDDTDVERLTLQIEHIDVAILNAGCATFGNVYELKDVEIDEMLLLNIRSPIMLAKKLAPAMMERNAGHFIFIGSQAGKVATKKASVYAATKHAMTGFVDGFRQEVTPYHIHVTGIFPGPIDTPFLQKADATNTYKKSLGRFILQPEKVARAVVKTIEQPVRTVDIPGIMSITSKLYALAPAIIEKLGARFFNKK